MILYVLYSAIFYLARSYENISSCHLFVLSIMSDMLRQLSLEGC